MMWKVILAVLGFLVGFGLPVGAFWVILQGFADFNIWLLILHPPAEWFWALRWTLAVSLFTGVMACGLGAIFGANLDRRRHLRFTVSDLFAGVLLATIVLGAITFENGLRRELEKRFSSERMRVADTPLRRGVWTDPFVAISPDGRLLARGTQGVEIMWEAAPDLRLWDLPTLRERPTDFGPGWQRGDLLSSPVPVAFSSDGRLLAAGLKRGITLWDVTTGQERATISVPKPVSVLAFSPDGKTLVGAVLNTAPTPDETEEVKLWDVATKQEVATVGGFKEKAVYCVAISPDERRVATVSSPHPGSQGALQLWDMATGEDYATFGNRWTYSTVRCARFSPDGKLLAAGGTYKIRLLDATTGQMLANSGETPVGLWNYVAFSADGTILATANAAFQKDAWGSVDGRAIRLWDVVRAEDGATVELRLRCTLQKHARYYVNCMVFAPDGKTLTTVAAGEVRTWDVASGKEISTAANADRFRITCLAVTVLFGITFCWFYYAQSKRGEASREAGASA